MPQPRSGRSNAGSAAKTPSSSGRARSSRSSGSASTRSTRSSGSSGSTRSRSASAGGDGAAGASSDPRLDAAAERLRKLNERIIDAGRQTGETTLASYEKALKAIASAVERGPGSSDIDWISQLATTQAKFIRDVTDAWTAAARQMLK